MRIHLRLNLQTPHWATPPEELHPVALEMAQWADSHGFDAVRIGEHHATPDNWCPSTTTLASAVAAVTQQLTIQLSAYLLPLHNPLQAAEELAVLDLISEGRLEVVVGAGYRQAEFDMFGVKKGTRGQAVEEGVTILRQAWTGETFEHRGRQVRITPKPSTPGGPPLQLGGSSSAMAKRAVKLDVGFQPTNAEAYEAYQRERLATGQSKAAPYSRSGPHLIHVTDDVDSAWRVLDAHLRHEADMYNTWSHDDTPQPATRIEDLRNGGQYLVTTPDQAIKSFRDMHPETILTLHPLVSGLAPKYGWRSLQLFADEVMPALKTSVSSPQ